MTVPEADHDLFLGSRINCVKKLSQLFAQDKYSAVRKYFCNTCNVGVVGCSQLIVHTGETYDTNLF